MVIYKYNIGNSGNFDQLLMIIQNLEKKVYIQFEKIDEEQSKSKNDITNLIRNLDHTNKQTTLNKEQIDALFKLIEELKLSIKNQSDLFDKAMKDQLAKIYE